MDAPLAMADLAMAAETPPIPPSTYPHAPLMPSSSPITWCSNTYLYSYQNRTPKFQKFQCLLVFQTMLSCCMAWLHSISWSMIKNGSTKSLWWTFWGEKCLACVLQTRCLLVDFRCLYESWYFMSLYYQQLIYLFAQKKEKIMRIFSLQWLACYVHLWSSTFVNLFYKKARK